MLPELDAPASKAPEGLGNSANQVPADCLEVERRTSLRLTQQSIAFGARSGKHPRHCSKQISPQKRTKAIDLDQCWNSTGRIGGGSSS